MQLTANKFNRNNHSAAMEPDEARPKEMKLPKRKLLGAVEDAAWSRVDVADDFFIGSTEGGFLGLEEFKPSAKHFPQVVAQASDSIAPKGRKAAHSAKPAPAPAQHPLQLSITHASGPQIGSRKRRKLNKIRKHAADDLSQQGTQPSATTLAPSSSAQQSTVELLNVSAWDQLGLDDKLLQALAELRFSAPTPIQQECLPSAIRDRRDVIGAAQTVLSVAYPKQPRIGLSNCSQKAKAFQCRLLSNKLAMKDVNTCCLSSNPQPVTYHISMLCAGQSAACHTSKPARLMSADCFLKADGNAV